MRPAPTTRTCFSRRSPSAPSASARAIELAVAGFAPIAVSERARRPVEIAVRKRSVSPGPTVPAALAGAERVTDLAEDLRLAEDERVEARGDATQVARDVLSRVHVEMVEQELARDAVRGRERIDELVARVVDTGGQARVELDAVTRLQHRVLEDGRAALRAGTERADALAELDRSGAMAEPETDESVHARKLYCGSRGRMLNMRALGIDVGGTFTDAVLLEDGEIRIAKVPDGARQQESVVAAAAAVGAVGRRPLHARHDDRDERASPAARRAHRARDERGLRARPPPAPTDARAPLPPVRRALAAARPARALRRRARAYRPGRRARPARPRHAP